MEKSKDKKRNWKKPITICLIILLVIIVFWLGSKQGYYRALFISRSNNCDNPIYPYGCKMDENVTHCYVMDCSKTMINWQNGALCYDFGEMSERKNQIYNLVSYPAGLFMTGCLLKFKEVGINPQTMGENWAITWDSKRKSCPSDCKKLGYGYKWNETEGSCLCTNRANTALKESVKIK